MADWQTLREKMGLPEMSPYYDRAWAQFDPATAQGPLLDRAFIREHIDLFRFSEELLGAIFHAEDCILADADALLAAHFLYQAIFTLKKPYTGPYVMGLYPAALGDISGLFPLCVLLRNAPRAYAAILEHGLDVQDVTGNFRSLNSFTHQDGEGRWKLDGVGWCIICITEYLNTVGTLRFAPAVIEDTFTVYRSRKSGECRTLIAGDRGIRADGLLANSAEDTAYTTRWAEGPGFVEACEVRRDGFVLPEAVRIELAEWEAVLGPGDAALEYHIPTAKNYTPENCADSFEKAIEYFEAHFDDLFIKGIWCYSWLYCPQLRAVFDGRESGILRMQEALRLVPVQSGPESFQPFVFDVPHGTKPEDLPEDTFLRRALKQAMLRGDYLCTGGVQLPKDEIAAVRKGGMSA